MTYKVNHVLRARTRTALADLIRRLDDLQVKALMNTLCLADGTVWSEASRLIRRLPQREGGPGHPVGGGPRGCGVHRRPRSSSAACSARRWRFRWPPRCATTSGGGRRSAPSTACVRRPSASTPTRRAAIGSSSYPRGRAAAWNAAWLGEIAAARRALEQLAGRPSRVRGVRRRRRQLAGGPLPQRALPGRHRAGIPGGARTVPLPATVRGGLPLPRMRRGHAGPLR